MTQQALADAAGIGFQNVSHYERGYKRAGLTPLARLAEALSVPISYFTGDLPPEQPPPAQTEPITRRASVAAAHEAPYFDPVVVTEADERNALWVRGTVAAGTGFISASDEPVEFAAPTLPEFKYEDWKGCYALRVTGNSMEPLVVPGGYVVVKPLREPIPGTAKAALDRHVKRLVIARADDGETTLKALARAGRHYKLMPANHEEHEPITLTDRWAVIARVVCTYAPFAEPETEEE